MRLIPKSKLPLAREAGDDEAWIGRAALDELLAKPIGPARQDQADPVSKWVHRAAGQVEGFDPREARRILAAHGLKVYWDAERDTYLAVSHWHPELSLLFGAGPLGDRFGSIGGWIYDLRHLPGVRSSAGGLYFGGETARAVLIPLDVVFSPDLEGSTSRASCAA